MGPNPFPGVIYPWIGGFASATNFIPFRGIKRWSWEVYWLIQGFAAWIAAPLVLASIFAPNLTGVLHTAYQQNPGAFHDAILCGLALLIGSTVIAGDGNNLKAGETVSATAALR